MNEHITSEQAARWVCGLSDEPESAALERHVAACSACTKVLQQEAVAEQVLVRAVATMPARDNVVSLEQRFRTRAVVAVAVAIAATVVLLVRAPEPKPDSRPAEPMTFIVIDAGDEAGELVLGVPRYEEGHQLPVASLTANEPFPL